MFSYRCGGFFKIYNISGQEIIALVEKYQIAGSHSVTWHGNLANGEMAPSGIYLYRLQTGNGVQVRKMVLTREFYKSSQDNRGFNKAQTPVVCRFLADTGCLKFKSPKNNSLPKCAKSDANTWYSDNRGLVLSSIKYQVSSIKYPTSSIQHQPSRQTT